MSSIQNSSDAPAAIAARHGHAMRSPIGIRKNPSMGSPCIYSSDEQEENFQIEEGVVRVTHRVRHIDEDSTKKDDSETCHGER